MKHIGFDHSYTKDPGHKFFDLLGRCGFALSENKIEHPGKHFCRFILFRPGRAGRAYLEFVHVGKGGWRLDRPGVSLRYEGPLKEYFSAIKRQKGVKAKYGHKNYKWKEDSKSKLPGWNFVTFQRPKFKNLFPWFTEYEPNPYKKRTTPPLHPNTARYICGMELVVRAADRPKLEKIFGKKFAGTEISLGGIKLFVEAGKSTRVSALVVRFKSLKTFLRHAKQGAGTVWRGRNAVRIKNPAMGMWDILAVEN